MSGRLGTAVRTVFVFLFLSAPAHAATLYWVGGNGDDPTATANDWSTANPLFCTNGLGNAGAVPGPGDTAVFDADCDNSVTMTGDWTVGGLTMDSGYAGTIDAGTNTLTVSGPAALNGGTVNNGTLDINASISDTVTFGGSTLGVNVDATAGSVLLNGATFNGTASLEKTGAGSSFGSGGNTFNGATELINSGAGYLLSGNASADTFNGQLTLTSTSSGAIRMAYAAAGTQFNENVILISTDTGGVYLGENAGTSTLADTKTITIGGSGFASGTLSLSNFTQTGTTAQSWTLTGSASLYLDTGTMFNGAATFTAPNIYLHGSTFNAAATLEKTGSTTNFGNGGNTFNGATELINSGTGYVLSGGSTADIFNGQLTLTSTSSGTIRMAYAAAGTQFNENVVLNSTSTGGIYFSESTGTATLADTKTITIGGSGFAGGMLSLSDFTQTGTTAQSLTLTGSASLILGAGTTFNGAVTFTAPNIYLYGSTFNAAATIEKTGSTTNSGDGGNTFNGATELINSGTGYLLSASSSADTFNGQLTLTSTNSGTIRMANGVAGTQFNENVVVNSTGTGGVYLGENAGTSTLADTKTLTVGGSGFSGGTLYLRGLTQTGATAQSFTLTGSAALHLHSDSTFNGNGTFTAPLVYLSGTTFNGTATIEQTGTSNSASSVGGNTFNATTEMILSGTGYLRLGTSSGDTFNGQTTFTSLASGVMHPAYSSTGNAFNENVIVNSTSTGGVQFGSNLGTSTLADTKTLTVGGSGFSGGTLYLRGFTQTGGTAQSFALTGSALLSLQSDTTFNGNVTFTAPLVYLSGTTFNGTATVEQTGATNSALSVGGNTFNSTTEIIVSGAGYLRLGTSSGDTFNGQTTFTSSASGVMYPAYSSAGNAFNEDILLNSTSTGGVVFGSNLGTSTLADTKTLAVGGSGFSGGTLYLRGLTQIGATAQSFTLTGSALLNLQSGSTFNGNVTFTAPLVYLTGTTFNGTATIEQTGATNSAVSVGGNTFNSTAEIIVSGTGYLRLPASGSADVYNGNATFTNSSTGVTYVAYGANANFDGNATANSFVSFGTNGGTLVFTEAAGTQTFDSAGVTVPRLTHSGAGTLQLTTSNLTVSTALNNSAGTIDLNGQNLTATGATFSNDGTMQLIGTETITGLTQDADSGTWTYVGDGDAGADSITIQDFGATDYYNLAINSTDGATDSYVLTSDKVIAGTVTLTAGDMETDGYDLDIGGAVSVAGTLDATDDVEGDATAIQVGSNWTNTGTFTYADSTVDFDDDTQNNTFTGDTTFNNLTISTAQAKTATFTAGSTQTVAGTMTFTGAASNLLTLQSSSGGTVWNLDPTGTRSVNYLNVSDSYNPGATINAVGANSTNGGNNTGWFFTAAAGSNVVWIGAGGDNNWSTGANWSSGSAPNSSQIAVFDATSVKNCTIDTNVSVLGVSIADGYDGTITQSGSNTITVGTSDWIQADGTFTGGSGGFSISGDLLINGGTFTPGTQTFTFTGTNSTWTPGAGTYDDIVINKTTGHSVTLTNGTTADVDGTLTLTEGLLSGNSTITLAGDLTVDATFDGTWNATITVSLNGTGTQAINGSAAVAPTIDINKASGTASLTAATAMNGLTVTAGTFDPAGYTITFGRYNATWTPGAETYADVVVNKFSGYTLTMTDATTADVDGSLRLTEGIISGDATIALSGDLTVDATFDGTWNATITVSLNGTGAQAINGSAAVAPTIDINKASGTASLTAATAMNGLTITAGTFDPAGYTITFGRYNATWTPGAETYADVVLNKFDGYTLTVTAATTADVDGSLTLTEGLINGNATIALAGDLTVESTFNGSWSNPTVISFNGTGAQSINGSAGVAPTIDINKASGTASLTADTALTGLTVTAGTFDPAGYQVTFSRYSASWTPGAETYGNVVLNKFAGYGVTITAGATADVNGTLTLTEGFLTGTGSVSAAGDVTIASTFDGGTAPLTFDGAGTQTFDLTGATGTFNANITVNKAAGEVTLASDLLMDAAGQDLTLREGTLNLAGYNLTVTDQFTIEDGGGLAFNGDETVPDPDTLASGSTVTYTAASGTRNIKSGAAWNYHHLIIDGDGGAFTVSGAEDINGNLTVTSGRFDASDQSLTIDGNTLVDGGIFHTGSGAVTFGDAGADSVTVSDGTLIVESNSDTDITLNASTWTNSGGTIMYTTDDAATLFNSAAVQPYYNLNLNDGLMGYWKLDDTSSPALDSSGYGLDGTWAGNAQASATVSDVAFANPQSILLDGNGDYVHIARDVTLTYPFTMTAWLKASNVSPTDHMIFTYVDSTQPDIMYGIGLDEAGLARIMARNTGTTEALSSAEYDDNQWHHIVGVFSSDTSKLLYVDGVLVSTLSNNVAMAATANRLAIGRWSDSTPSSYFPGNVDDVRLYTRALSEAEISALARGDLPSTQASGSTLTLTSALDVDGDLTLSSGELDNDATNDYAITVAGSWINQGGIFTNDGGTVTFNGTSGTHTIQAGNQDFYNMAVSGSGGTWTLAQAVMVSNDLTVATGATLDTSIYDIVLTNDLDIDGSLDLSTGYHSVSGSVDFTSGTVTRDTSTLVLNPATAGETLTAAAEMLNNMTMSTSDGLVGWWKLDETTADSGGCAGGEDFCDASGNGYHATVGGASGANPSGPAPVGDRAPVLFSNLRAFDFDGTDDHIVLPAGLPALNDFTFVMWVYLDSISSNAALSQRSANPENRFLLRATSEYFYINGNGTQSIITDSNIGSWVHVLIARRGSTAYYYRNGVNEGSWNAGTDAIQFASSTLSSSSAGSYAMDGRMDDVRLYSRALTASEIAALYRGHPLSATGAITLQDALTLDGDLVLGGGTYDVNDQTLSINGSAAIGGGTLKTGTGALAFGDGAGDAVTMTGGEIQIESDADADITVNAGAWTNTGGAIAFLDDAAQSFFNNTTVQPFYNLTINDSDGTYTTTTALDIDGALTLTDGTLDLDTNDNNINVAGDFTLTAGTYTMGSGTLTLDGDLTFTDAIGANMGVVAIGTSPDTTDLATDMICASLTVNDGDVLNTNGYDVDCSGAITIVGTLDATDDGEGDSTLITLGTNWANTGTFTYADSTVDFDDDGQNNAISGDTTFNNLTISTGTAKTVTFTAGDTQTVAGTLTLTGASSNVLSLVSSSPGTVWEIDPTGTRTVDYLNVTDSYNPGATIDVRALNVADGGNNTGWLYSDPGTLTWTGEGANNNWSNGDNWFGGSAPNSSQTAVFDDTSVKNCTIDANIDVAGIDIQDGYDGTIAQSGAFTVTVGSSHWTQADGVFTGGSGTVSINGNFTLSTGTITQGSDWTVTGNANITGSGSFATAGYELDVDGDMTLSGTLNATDSAEGDTSFLYIGGSWNATGGTFIKADSTVLFNGTGAETVTSAGVAFQNLTVNDGLVGYWKLDETTFDGCADGEDACDSSGYGYHTTEVGTTTISASVPTVHFNNVGSFEFDGSSAHLNANAAVFDPTNEQLTFAAWMNTDSITANQKILGKRDTDSVNDGYHFEFEGATVGDPLSFGIFGASDVDSSASGISADQWYHVAVTYDKTNVIFYLNGVVLSSSGVTSDIQDASNEHLYIGAYNSDGTALDYFDGNLDEVRIYSRVLSAAEIAALARGDLPAAAASGSSLTLADALDIDGDLTLNSGDMDNAAASDYAITVAGAWMNNGGKFTNDGGVVTFNGTSGTHSIQAGNEDFYNMTVSGNGGTWNLVQDVMVSNDLTVASGATLDTNAYDLIITNDMDIDGNLDLASGVHSGMGSIDFTNGTITEGTSALVLNPGTAGETLTAGGEALNDLVLTSTDALIGWWKMDTATSGAITTGTSIPDSSSSGYDGTASNTNGAGMAWAPGKLNGAVSFDTTDDAINVGKGGSLDNLAALSIAFWSNSIGYGGGSSGYIATKNNSSSNGWSFRKTSNGSTLQFFADYDGASDLLVKPATNTLATADFNTWVHFTLTWDGSANASGVRIYKNGVETGYLTQTSGDGNRTSDATRDLYFGNWAGLNVGFGGMMDDVRLYDRVLTSGEVAALAGGHPLSSTGTITLQDALDIDGGMVLGDGTFDANDQSITVAGDWVHSAATFTSGSNTVTFDGGSTQSINSGGTGIGADDTGADFNNLTISGSTLQLTGTEVEVDGTLTIDAAKTLDLNGYDLDLNGTLANSGTVQLLGSEDFGVGTLDTDSGLFKYVGTSSATIPSTLTSYYNLEFDESGTSNPTYTMPDASVTVYGDLTITDATLAADNDKLLNIKGNFANSDTFAHSSGTVMLSGAGSTTLTTNGSPFFNLVLNDGLVGYWKLDDTSSPAVDSSGYGNDGIWQADTAASSTVPAGHFNNARSASFDGTGDYINIPDSDLIEGIDALTVAVWAQSDVTLTAEGRGVVSNYFGAGDTMILYLRDADNMAFGLVTADGAATADANADLADTSWHHYAGVYNGSNLLFYVDGVLQTDQPVLTGLALASTNPLTIGSYSTNRDWDGLIDDVRIYKRALLAAEISALANGTHPQAAAAGSSVTLADALDIDGDLIINSGGLNNAAANDYAIAVAGSWWNNGGQFTNDGGTVTFDGTGGTHSIQAGSEDFHVLQLNGTGGTWSLTQDVMISDDLDIDAGTLDTNGYDLIIADDMDIDASLDLASGYHSVGGIVDLTNGTVTADTSTLVLSPSTAGETLTAAAETLNDLTLTSTEGLVGWWKFDETAPNLCAGGVNDACDSSGNGRNGAYSGASLVASTNVVPMNFSNVRSLEFDGSDHVSMTNVNLDGQAEMTIALWIKPDLTTVAVHGLVHEWNSTSGGPILFINGTDDINWQVDSSGAANGGRLIAANVLTPDVWQHVVATFAEQGATDRFVIYHNGSEVNADSLGSANAAHATTFKIGHNEGVTNKFHGLMDDVRVYNRALAASEVVALYRGHPLSATGTMTLQDALDIDGDMVLGDGTFATGANTITVAGDWTNSAAAFTYGTSTVDFNDDTQNNTITGDTTFYNLTISTAAAKTVTFGSGSTTSIADNGTLTLSGASGQLLTLGPGTAATDWLIDVSATGTTIDVDYVSTTYSDASGGERIVAQSSIDGAPGSTNTNWSFPATYTWTGASDNVTWEDAGNWDLSDYPDSADAKVIINATAHSITTAGALTIGELEVTSGFSGTITLGGTLSTSIVAGWSAGLTLNGGTLTTGGSVDINGPLLLNGAMLDLDTNDNNINVSGNFTLTSGTYTAGSGTLTLDGDLTFTDSIGTSVGILEIGTSPDTTDLATDLTCASLTVNLGDILNTNGYDVDCSGDITITGTLDATDDAEGDTTYLYTGGSWTVTGTFTAADSTVLLDGTGTETLTSGGQSLYNMTVNDGLVGYWKLDETGANSCPDGTSDACDSSGYLRHGNWTNAPVAPVTHAPVHFANVYSFDTNNTAYVTVADNGAFDFGAGDFSVAVWVQKNNANSSNSDTWGVNKWNTGGSPGTNEWALSLSTASGNDIPGFSVEIGSTAHSAAGSTALTIGRWHHLVGVRSGTNTFLYVDGVQAGTAAGVSGSVNNLGLDVMIAESAHGNAAFRPDAVFDDVRIYNRALSAGEIATLARGDLPSSAASGSSVTLADALDINGDLRINAGDLNNAAASDYAITVAGSWTNNGGKFTNDGGAVTFDGTSGAHSVQAGNEDFYNIIVSGGGGTWNLGQDVMVSNDFTVAAGTLDTNAYDLIVINDMDIDAVLDLASGHHSVGGIVDFTNGTLTADTSTLILNPSTAGETLTAAAETLNNLTLSSTDGLVGWWRLDETALNTCNAGADDFCDFSGNSYHADESGGVTITTSTAPIHFANARAVTFDGTNDYLDMGDVNDLTEAVTVAAWVRLSGAPHVQHGDGVLTKGVGADNNAGSYELTLLNDYSVYGRIYTSAAVTANSTGTVLTPGRWTHVAVTYDRINLRTWINGANIATTAHTAAMTPNGTPLTIGVRSLHRGGGNDSFFGGQIDDVRLYNRALTSSELAALAGGHPLSSTGTVTLQDTLDIDGDMHLGDGTFDANGQNIAVAGDWINSAATFTSGANTVTFDGGSTQSINADGTGIGVDDTGADFSHLTISGSTLQLTGTELEVDGTLTVAATKILDLNGYDMDLNGTLINNGTVQLLGSEDFDAGTLDTDSGLFKYVGTASATIPAELTSYYNVEFDESGTSDPTYTLPDAPVTVYGDLTITDGALAADDDKLLNIKGSFTNSGTFAHNSGTVMLSGTSAETVTTNGSAFHKLTLNDGLIAYWKFDEGADNTCSGGEDVCDSSGYGRHGTINNGNADEWSATTADTRFSNAFSLDLDGSDDYVNVGVVDAVDEATTLSTCVWLNLDSDANNNAIWATRLNSGDGILFFRDDVGIDGANDVYSFYVDSFTGGSEVRIESPAGTAVALEWTHVCVTIDLNANELRMYLDGGEVDSSPVNVSTAPDISSGGKSLIIGANGSTALDFGGLMDDLRIYNRVLSEAEITALARGDLPVTAASGSSVTMADALNIDGDLIINSGDLDNSAASDYAVTVAGSWMNNGGKFTNDGGTVTIDGTSGTHSIQAGNEDFYVLQLNGAGGTWNLTQDMMISDDLDIDAGTLDTNGYDLVITDDMDIDSNLDLASGTHSVGGIVDFTNATVTADTSTLVLNPATAGETLTAASETLNNVVLTSTDGLVGWWKLDETALDTCNGGADDFCDSAGSNHGDESGGVTISTNVAPVNFSNAQALQFDGTDDYISTGLNSSSVTSPFSVTGWFRASEFDSGATYLDNHAVVGWRNSGTVHRWAVGARQGRFAAAYYTVSQSYNVGSTLQENTWYHFAYVYDGSALNAYLNGVLDIGPTSFTMGASYQDTIKIGGHLDRFFNGTIDDVRIYNRTLTASEIAALAGGHPLSTTGTITLQDALDIDGDMVLGDGTFTAGANTITVAGDWTNESATFTAGTGTVDFNDDAQNNTIHGSTSFYNLVISTGTAKTVWLESGKTQTILAGGSLTLTGASGQVLTLAPLTAATDWLLTDNADSQSVSHVSVTYSDASGGAEILTATSTDGAPGGTNTNWCFTACLGDGASMITGMTF